MNEQTLEEIQSPDSTKEKEYINDTAFERQVNMTEDTFEYGTIKINKEYGEQANIALKTRIEGTEDYTNARIERINKNYDLFDNKGGSLKAEHNIFIPETRNACLDWVDDLVDIFSKLSDSIEIDSKKNVLDRHLVRTLTEDESDDDTPRGMGRSLLAAKSEQARKTYQEQLENSADENEAQKIQEQLDILKTYKSKGVYYFRCLDTIKGLLKDGLEKAEYAKKIERFARMGVISGDFMLKKSFERIDNEILRLYETTKNDGYMSFGKFVKEVEREQIFNFEPVDTRNIIHRQDKKDWIIEKIDTNFWNLLNSTIDDKGKQKKNATYDYAILKELPEKLKLSTPPGESKEDQEQTAQDEKYSEEDVKRIDGDVRIYEAHNIPFKYKVKDLRKRIGGQKYENKANNDTVVVKSIIVSVFADDKFYPIRIQPSVWGNPYESANFAEREGDCAGTGQPEILESLQTLINENYNLFLDLLDMALKGIAAFDEDKIINPNIMDALKAGDTIKLKDMLGGRIEDVIQFFRPPLDSLGPMVNIMDFILQQIAKTSRKGPGGEKIQPNPSATELATMVKEMQKSVNRLVFRLNNLFKDVIKDMYVYTLMNRKENFNLKLLGYRLNEPPEQLTPQINPMPTEGAPDQTEQENIETSYSSSEKWVEVKPEEIFVDDIAFKIKSFENAEKQAVERQQSMQFLEIAMKQINPQTGQPMVFVDDTNTPVQIDMWKIMDKVAKNLGQEDIWKKKPRPKPVPQLPGAPNLSGGPTASGPPSVPTSAVPPVNSSTRTGDLLGKAVRV